ncbi:MAG: MBL fold metallo-hydrolase [Kofleriaceae bacterium]
MKIRFWGVRGSIPSPGPDTNRYGGNTSCVSVRAADGTLVILDMGTGLMHLGNELLAGEFGAGRGHATILLSHSHWDHIQGLGFFAPVFVGGNAFALWGRAGAPGRLEVALEGQMNPNYSPLYTLRNLGATFTVHELEVERTVEVGPLRIRAHANPHGNTTALAFRIEEDGRALVYASDVGYPEGGPSAACVAFYRGAHTLIHDTTYTPADQVARRARGFSSYEDAAAAAVTAGVGRLAMFHYDQDYGDADVDALRDACRAALDARGGAGIELVAAAEGLELEI